MDRQYSSKLSGEQTSLQRTERNESFLRRLASHRRRPGREHSEESLYPRRNVGKTTSQDSDFDLVSSEQRKLLAAQRMSRAQQRQSKKSRKWNPQVQISKTPAPTSAPAKKAAPRKAFKKAFPWVRTFLYSTGGNDGTLDIIIQIRNFIAYLIYLCLLLFIFAFQNYDNYAAFILSDVFTKTAFPTSTGTSTTFRSLRSPSQIWDFIDGVLLKVFYEQRGTGYGNENYTVLTENILLGAPQLRQLRVKNNTCHTVHFFQDLYKTCYDYYSKENKDKEPFGLMTHSWQYVDGDEFETYHGLLSTYSAGGYTMNFTGDYNFTKASLTELKDNVWIRHGTRLVTIDFNIFSPGTGSYSVVHLIFEMLPSGGVVNSSKVYVLKLIKYTSIRSYWILSCEVLLLIFTIHFTVETVHQMILLKKKYITEFFNIVDIIIIALAYTILALDILCLVWYVIYFQVSVEKVYTSDHTSLNRFLMVHTLFRICGGFLLAFVFIKLFKFTFLSKSMTFIQDGFYRVRYELLSLVIFTALITMGFAIAGTVLFGSHVTQFRTVREAFFTLISLSVTGPHFYEECLYAKGIVAPLYFAAYIAFMSLICLNAFIALIVLGVEKAGLHVNDYPDRIFYCDILRTGVILALKFMKMSRLAEIIEQKQIVRRNEIDYDDFIRIMLRHRWKWFDIRLFMHHHGIERENEITFEKFAVAYDDFWLRSQLFIEVNAHTKIQEEMVEMKKVLEYCENELTEVKLKAELVADKAALRTIQRSLSGII